MSISVTGVTYHGFGECTHCGDRRRAATVLPHCELALFVFCRLIAAIAVPLVCHLCCSPTAALVCGCVAVTSAAASGRRHAGRPPLRSDGAAAAAAAVAARTRRTAHHSQASVQVGGGMGEEDKGNN